ncbi:MAG: ImmA/IrrE family metallo-endopeptidase [Deltaproteobacteria bacterium]|nr:ImmA/IrrE family metallo-endopeptidase [Deltaproteobacteria bacterium]
MVGTGIRSQRERLGLPLDRAADIARLPAERVALIEAGGPLTVQELWALGDALAFDPAELLRGEQREDPRRTAGRFRAPTGVRELAAEDARLLARAAELGRVGAYLQQQLGLPPGAVVERRHVKAIDPARESWREGYHLGEKARQRLSPERAPIRSIQTLLEAAGVHVATVQLSGNDLLAAAIYEPGAVPVILVNGSAPRARQPLSRRAILAHELCHLLHDGGTHDLLTLVSRQENHEPYEQRANGFAPAFLAPRAWLQADGDSARERVRNIAQQWGFSREGATWHAKSCGVISPEEAEALVKQGDAPTGYCEWESTPPRLPPSAVGVADAASPLVEGLVQDLVVRAFQEGAISSGRARELLRFS